jgi:flagella synthesis protein FlgN
MEAELRRVLEGQLTSLRRLNVLLEEEGEALANRQADRIDQLRADKQQAIDHLGETTRKLDQLLEREGFPADGAGLEGIIEERCDEAGLHKLRQEVTAALSACQRLNQINGNVAERSRRSIEQALRILACPADNPDLYQASGKLGNLTARRSIGKA